MKSELPEEISSFLDWNKWDKNSRLIHKEVIICDPQQKCSISKCARDLYKSKIIPFYGHFYDTHIENMCFKDESGKIIPVNGIQYILREAAINANVHGGDGKNKHTITIDIFLTPKKFVCGLNDEGDYFTNPNVKEKWEKREHIKTGGLKLNKQGEFLSGYNLGIDRILYFSDLIYVDNNIGTLYLGHSLFKERS